MPLESSQLEAHCTAIVRDEVLRTWRQSGFGWPEPPAPVLHVHYERNDGQLAINIELDRVLSWVFPWDGTDDGLIGWLEIVAADYWAHYVDPDYDDWHPPGC